MFEAYAALGANLGDRERSLREAVRRLAATEGIEVRRCSALYETDPVGYTEQPAFLNMAAALGTNLSPLELLRVMLGIEREMGRVRDIRFGPRTIDLDLLLYEGIELDTEELALPHPRMGERAFVLVPLRDVWADGPEAFPWNGLLTEPVLKEAGIKVWAPWGGVPKER
ncbi:2-amino-4-hydroxy-6-hydroxymethyldihydropteridine diphosphokinase [Cohnella algarum]|uniref:2-amino-4-hydroxy-6- hydroxymethyldihydropteridine diphosphokinase n=1 Tax=Cohnella algarum TaxID=2044859 RepID=UPI00196891CC|nr:2-amino-4-hydroxy-6-hydroxymethyldihydropteridine diphosphokinase [Cohnella algarum]